MDIINTRAEATARARLAEWLVRAYTHSRDARRMRREVIKLRQWRVARVRRASRRPVMRAAYARRRR